MAYIGGPRESRRLMGDVILTREDILDKREFPDGCVPSTWSIDLHYAKQQYAKKYPDNPFISYAQFDHRVDRKYGYPIPYRCFYSRNVTNLFMAGRCISVTHEALGTTRVMKTCGMMGEVVGKAASICVRHDTTPRGVYEKHWDEMDTLLKLPGKVRRLGVDEPFLVNDDARDHDFIDGSTLPGVIIDDIDAKRSGGWEFTDNLAGHVNAGYLYTSAAEAEIRYDIPVKKPGRFEVRMSYQPHSNRSTKTSVTVIAADGEHVKTVNQRIAGQMPHGFHTLGVFEFTTDKPAAVIIHSRGADGVVNADAVQIIELN
jgi:hypothetical protein